MLLQFNADANEAESWIKEKLPLCQSADYGEDEPSGLALLQLHARLEEEIKSYDGDIKAINSQGQKLIKSGISALNVSCMFLCSFLCVFVAMIRQSIYEVDCYHYCNYNDFASS